VKRGRAKSAGGVVGVDPAWAKPCAAAYVGQDGAWAIETVDYNDRNRWEALFSSAKAAGCAVVAIEQPYLGANPRTYGQLVTAASHVEACALACDIQTVRINTQAWMSAMLTVNGYTPKHRLELLPTMVYVAKALGADLGNAEDDKAAAVCIAEYWTSQRRQTVG
jgi:hypothetical protein